MVLAFSRESDFMSGLAHGSFLSLVRDGHDPKRLGDTSIPDLLRRDRVKE
jgi:hypothetical protein